MSHTSEPGWLIWIGGNWLWVVLVLAVFGGSIVAWCADIIDILFGPFRQIMNQRHMHRMDELKLKRQIRQAARSEQAGIYAGPCRHHNVCQVRSAEPDNKLVAWLCKDCDTELPADWSVVRED